MTLQAKQAQSFADAAKAEALAKAKAEKEAKEAQERADKEAREAQKRADKEAKEAQEKANKAAKEQSAEDPIDEMGSSSAQAIETPDPSSYLIDVPTGAIVVSSVEAAAPGSEPSPISGNKAARSIALDLERITPAQYKEAIIQNVASAPVLFFFCMK